MVFLWNPWNVLMRMHTRKCHFLYIEGRAVLITTGTMQQKFWFKTVSFVAAEICTRKMYQLFFPYILWDKYHHPPVSFMIVLFSKNVRK